MTTASAMAIRAAESGWLPDPVIRLGIRTLLRRRLEQSVPSEVDARAQRTQRFLAEMDASPVAVAAFDANRQHYEVPSRFFELVLGAHLKYSCCLFQPGTIDLDDAEAAMLALTCRRAEIEDGMRILELGCGWGSLSLWLARNFPACRITAVSNSRTQKAYVDARAAAEGIENLKVITADMNAFEIDARFDRVVSVEMFEHIRNWRSLMTRAAGWLEPGGKLFMHVFCHRDVPYFFENEGDDDWMSQHFFTGGLMPSADLALRFQEHLDVERVDVVNGRHYAATCEAWLANLDGQVPLVLAALAAGDDPTPARLQLERWRLFFLACAGLFAYRGGNEWFVSHYLFRRK